jgi:hypothetical protein
MIMRTSSDRPLLKLPLARYVRGSDSSYVRIIEWSALMRLCGPLHNRMARPRALAARRPGAEPGSREGAIHDVTMRDAAVGEGPPSGGRAVGGRGGERGQACCQVGGDYVASLKQDLRQVRALGQLRNITTGAT